VFAGKCGVAWRLWRFVENPIKSTFATREVVWDLLQGYISIF
jgi:hypothetical protein